MEKPEKMITVLIVEPMKQPYAKDIPDELASLQEIVGGHIEEICPFDDSVGVIANEEAKLMGLPPNRLLKDKNGEPYDVLCGTFFITGLSGDSFCSLSEEQLKKYKNLYGREMLLSAPRKSSRNPER